MACEIMLDKNFTDRNNCEDSKDRKVHSRVYVKFMTQQGRTKISYCIESKEMQGF